MSLFDETNLAEVTHPDYPGQRLVACRNPALAVERARKGDELLAAAEADLAKIAAATTRQRQPLRGQAKIGLRVGKIINAHKMAKHFELTITDTSLAVARNHDTIAAEAALDGIYVVRASAAHNATLDAPALIEAYKDLKFNEAGFRSLKAIDLDLRPIFHHTETRVRAHVFICMLALYLVWHLRRAVGAGPSPAMTGRQARCSPEARGAPDRLSPVRDRGTGPYATARDGRRPTQWHQGCGRAAADAEARVVPQRRVAIPLPPSLRTDPGAGNRWSNHRELSAGPVPNTRCMSTAKLTPG